ncbi:hypothetical protein Pcinc_015637 [Petrolisthes cinctipes]|uniref:Amino acid transporter transmembrane domain-containing protein n=1 Tax=Petrolisthes cinctipes TaxID=88211 RepID=A0AAE1FUF6_PETCI|nr:hypothetical protein Pcinc_015637 [Petrolisthes cinctipes]
MDKDKAGGAGGEVGEVGGLQKGLSVTTTALFLMAQIASAGFLSLPKAFANTGWVGPAMMVVFCLGVGFSGTRLGYCWVIMEERWPHRYGQGSRQPYMEMAERTLGRYGRSISLVLLVITLLGATTVYLILTANFLNALVDDLSSCEWVLVTGAVLLPFTWLGTPKDFWQVPLLAMLGTIVAVVVVVVEVLVEADLHPNPVYYNPTVYTFFLGFGAILYAFGGGVVFPAIQMDMKDRSQFWKSTVICFAVLLLLYLSVGTVGYVVQGSDVGSNVLLTLDTNKTIIKVAVGMEIINLLGSFLIGFNPMAQACEDVLNIDKKFGLKRVLLRSSLLLIEVVISLAVPSFDKILNLIGGSTVPIFSFILPSLMYMTLINMKPEPGWIPRSMTLWEKTLMCEMILVGVVGGISSTVFAIIDIVNPDSFSQSCFDNFT